MRSFLDNSRGSAAIPIDVVGHDATLNPYLCGTVQRRLAYALGPFADCLRGVQVRLADHIAGNATLHAAARRLAVRILKGDPGVDSARVLLVQPLQHLRREQTPSLGFIRASR